MYIFLTTCMSFERRPPVIYGAPLGALSALPLGDKVDLFHPRVLVVNVNLDPPVIGDAARVVHRHGASLAVLFGSVMDLFEIVISVCLRD